MSMQPDCKDDDVNPFWNSRPLIDELSLRESDLDMLATVRCPLCHFPLIAVQGKQGPRFQCACDER